MEIKRFIRRFLLLVLAFLHVTVYANSEQKIEAITKPCADVTLSFVQPGSISQINYREGDPVQVGSILVKQDDAVEQIRLEQLKAESENETAIQYAQITKAQRIVDLERLEKAGPDVTNPTELDYARLNVQNAELQLHMAQIQREQAIRKYEEAKKQITRMSLKSPIDGIIEKIFKESGESVNAIEDVIRVVRVDPLWIDVQVPYSIRENIRLRDKAIVEFPGPNKMTAEGSIIFKSLVGDSASETFMVRIQVPNKSNRLARETVLVTFPGSN